MSEGTLGEGLVLLAATLLFVPLLGRLRLPPIVGFLAVGMALGPHALSWVQDTATTRTLAEFGVVFLLFTLGLEFSLPRMIAMRNEVFALGSAQVGLTAAAFGGIAWWLGSPPAVAVVLASASGGRRGGCWWYQWSMFAGGSGNSCLLVVCWWSAGGLLVVCCWSAGGLPVDSSSIADCLRRYRSGAIS